jgi:DNA (cytosine-5)-methyltransferase 1
MASHKCNICNRSYIKEESLKKHKCAKVTKKKIIKNSTENHKNEENDDDDEEDESLVTYSNEEVTKIKKEYSIFHKNFTFIDLFCGIGGFHIALKNLGGTCVLACDIDKECRKIYEKNHHIQVMDNVYNLNAQNVPDHDVLCGGFPCQAFSNAGNKKAFDDKRGLLFDEIIRIMKDKKPKVCILENVKHIMKVSNGEVYEHIYDELKKCGYTCLDTIMSPNYIGIKQNRPRVIFMIVRNDLVKPGMKDHILNKINDLKKIHYSIHSQENIFEPLEKIDQKYLIPKEVNDVFDAWNEFLAHFPNKKFGVPVIIDYFHESQSNENKEWKNKYIEKNNELYNENKTFIDKWYSKYEEVLSKRAIYKKLEWQVGAVKADDKIDNYFIQLRQSGIRVKKIDYFPTLVAIVQVPIYGKERRYLTPKECARLQSIPDDFIWEQPDKYTYKQLGNGVNTSVIQLCAEAVLSNVTF